MTKPVGKWLLVRFAKLWNSFGNNEFNFRQAIEILNEDSKKVGAILNQLYKNNWAKRSTNPKDKRKRLYKLKNPERIIEELGNL